MTIIGSNMLLDLKVMIFEYVISIKTYSNLCDKNDACIKYMMYEQLIFKKYLYLNNNNKLAVENAKFKSIDQDAKVTCCIKSFEKKIFTLMPLAPNLWMHSLKGLFYF